MVPEWMRPFAPEPIAAPDPLVAPASVARARPEQPVASESRSYTLDASGSREEWSAACREILRATRRREMRR